LHHEMHVERHLDMRAKRRADQRPNGKVRHVMVVHHIEVNEVRTSARDCLYFFAESREVGRQDAGRDAIGHSRRVYNASMSERKEYDVAVSAQTQYLADQSDEASGHYVYAYHITIHHAVSQATQLHRRH